ncbi:response regulator [[Clostridium] sordellii ATCC 9714]|nr:response regulator [[Clostridium] sordellii ATCC 9714] [Paeniclostridium sordellii ATCC 9714]
MLDILVVEDEAPIRDWIVYTISNISDKFNVVARHKMEKRLMNFH